MAVYPVLTLEDLQGYTGATKQDYSAFAPEALRQATFMFKIATCLKEWPDDEDNAQLAEYAVLSMASFLVMKQPWAEIENYPLTSEVTMSHSWTRSAGMAMMNKLKSGEDTGVFWFDMAVSRLGVCDLGEGAESLSGSLHVFERDLYRYDTEDYGTLILGPGDDRSGTIPYNPLSNPHGWGY